MNPYNRSSPLIPFSSALILFSWRLNLSVPQGGATGIGCCRLFGPQTLQSRSCIAGADLSSQLLIAGWYGTHLSSSSFRLVLLQ
jgi:hypothetical protein